MADSLTLAPTATPGRFRLPSGEVVSAPDGWECLPPGDAGLTRRVKALGPTWAVVEKRGRKSFSRGLWAPAENVALARKEVAEERAAPAYARRRTSDTARREKAQGEYVEDFRAAVVGTLKFSADHADAERRLADAVAAHATPVGSGTVARTKRIPIGERAEAALIAWLRHQTTAYDSLSIARVKGERRRVRRQLADVSRRLIDAHRRDGPHDRATCTLCSALFRSAAG